MRLSIPADPAHPGWDDLFRAAQAGDPQAMADALGRGAHPNAWNFKRGPALSQAMNAPQGSLSCCKMLLNLGADPDHGFHMPPIEQAMRQNREDLLRLLLSFGASPNVRGALLPELCDMGVDKTSGQSSVPEPPLAAALADAEWVELLLNAGANPNARLRGETLAHRVCRLALARERSAELLALAGADLLALNDHGETPIQMAARVGRPHFAAAFERAALARSTPAAHRASAPRL